jgi:hypothetical protein
MIRTALLSRADCGSTWIIASADALRIGNDQLQPVGRSDQAMVTGTAARPKMFQRVAALRPSTVPVATADKANSPVSTSRCPPSSSRREEISSWLERARKKKRPLFGQRNKFQEKRWPTSLWLRLAPYYCAAALPGEVMMTFEAALCILALSGELVRSALSGSIGIWKVRLLLSPKFALSCGRVAP